MSPESGQKVAMVIVFAVISMTVTGYFVGLQAPMNSAEPTPGTSTASSTLSGNRRPAPNKIVAEENVVAAARYREMPALTQRRQSAWQTTLMGDAFASISLRPESPIEIPPGRKTADIAQWKQSRAFNGAPPTIPHTSENMSMSACLVCHESGHSFESMRIPKMSHQPLSQCKQCHVERDPQPFPARLFRENSFVGLSPPAGGPRAYPQAPPMIPHTTWMRVQCNSCHGSSGFLGMRTTHPERQNCMQCHAPSAQLEKTPLDVEPQFLSPPEISL